MPIPIVVGWSGGKDSMLALHELRRDASIDVVELMTTVTEEYDRISIHGVRRSLLRRQAASLGVPLREVVIPTICSNDVYEARMLGALAAARAANPAVEEAAFGDLFLEDVRAYRDRLLARGGLRGRYPLWGRDTAALARDVVRLGYRAIIVCIDTASLDARFAGRDYDEALLDELPSSVDPCGERGEFHTFAYDGPLFSAPVSCERGEIVVRDERFVYCDLIDSSVSAAD